MSRGIPETPLFQAGSPRWAVRVVLEMEEGVMPQGDPKPDLLAIDRIHSVVSQYATWAAIGVEQLVAEWHPERLLLMDEHIGIHTPQGPQYGMRYRLDIGRRSRLALPMNKPEPKREIPPDLAAELVEAEEVVAALRLHPRLLERVRELLG